MNRLCAREIREIQAVAKNAATPLKAYGEKRDSEFFAKLIERGVACDLLVEVCDFLLEVENVVNLLCEDYGEFSTTHDEAALWDRLVYRTRDLIEMMADDKT